MLPPIAAGPTAVIGAAALLIAVLSLIFFAMNAGPQFDTVIINDHVVGGTGDQLAALAIGALSGAVAVICAIRLRKRH